MKVEDLVTVLSLLIAIVTLIRFSQGKNSYDSLNSFYKEFTDYDSR